MVHDYSRVKDKPFIPVDCGTLLPGTGQVGLVRSCEGRVYGSRLRQGRIFQEADGGTLFLDEIGNLSLETQQMLLRAIQSTIPTDGCKQ